MSIRPQSGVKILLPVSEKSADLTSKFQSSPHMSRTFIHHMMPSNLYAFKAIHGHVSTRKPELLNLSRLGYISAILVSGAGSTISINFDT